MSRRRVFRRHWLAAFVRPGWWIAPCAVAIAILAAHPPYGEHVWWLLMVPVIALLNLYANWMSYSLSFIPAAKEVLERSGLVFESERRIPLGFIGNMAFEQNWFSRWLDYGTASLAAIGGPYEWSDIASFSDLRVALESRGENVPQARPPRSVIALRWLATQTWQLPNHIARVLRAQIDRARAIARRWSDERSVRSQFHSRADSGSPHDPTPSRLSGQDIPGIDCAHDPSYERFIWFVEHFVFDEGDWRPETYMTSNWRRCHFRAGVSWSEADQYLDILRRSRIIQLESHGRERLARRIHSLADVRRRIPDVWKGHGKDRV